MRSPPSGTTWQPASSVTGRTAGNRLAGTSSGSTRNVPSGRAVTADFRCSTLLSGTATTVRPSGASSARSWRMPSPLVRPPRPTYTVRPAWSTSPPSRVPGPSILAVRRPSARTASPAPATSGRRAGAPGWVSTARPSQTTTVSSMNTASGQSSAGGACWTFQPLADSASAYAACCTRARSRSTGLRLMCVTIPSARRLLGWRIRPVPFISPLLTWRSVAPARRGARPARPGPGRPRPFLENITRAGRPGPGRIRPEPGRTRLKPDGTGRGSAQLAQPSRQLSQPRGQAVEPALGVRGAGVRPPEQPDRAGQVVEIPAGPVQGQHGRVERAAGRLLIPVRTLTRLANDQREVAFRRGQAGRVPVDQHQAPARGQQVGRVRLAVRNDRVPGPGGRGGPGQPAERRGEIGQVRGVGQQQAACPLGERPAVPPAARP